MIYRDSCASGGRTCRYNSRTGKQLWNRKRNQTMAKNITLPAFLNEIDDICKRVSHKELVRRIHQVAQNLPDGYREGFLASFRHQDSRFEPLCEASLDFDAISLNVKERLELIANGKKQLDSEYNPQWNDWYNGEHEFLFTDDDCIVDDIRCALNFVHICIDRERYREGAEISRLLSQLQIPVVGEYNDVDDTIGLNDFIYEMGIHESCLDYMNEIIYALYMGNAPQDRLMSIYDAINQMDNYYDLSQLKGYANNELPEFDAFLKSWIEFLLNSNNFNDNCHLFSAQSLLDDIDFLISSAKKHLRKQPEFMLHILEDHQDADPVKLFHAGDYALKHFRATDLTSKTIRSKIALATSRIASKSKQTDRVHDCWIETFRSAPNVVNFLRLRILLPDYFKHGDCIKSIIKEHPRHDKVIDFFDGDFGIMPNCREFSKSILNEIYKIHKAIIALYILLLSKSDVLLDDTSALVKIFTDYCNLDIQELYIGSKEKLPVTECVPAFWELFIKWKSDYTISDEMACNWLPAIEHWIDHYVASMLKALCRREYEHCASFIAGYAGILQGMGKHRSKQQIMLEYKKKYSRYPAFHRELRAMGMRDK